MKKLLLATIVLSLTVFMTLQTHTDIEQQLMATCIIVDKAEDNDYNFYIECFRPSTSTSGLFKMGARVILNVKSKNLDEIFNKANLQASSRLNFTQCRVIMFTKKVAAEGLDNILPALTRPEEFVNRDYLCLWDDDPNKLYDLNLKGEIFLGLSLRSQLDVCYETVSEINSLSERDFYNDMAIGDRISFMPIVKVAPKSSNQLIDITGSGVIKKYKLVETIDDEKNIYLSFLIDKIKTVEIPAKNPIEENKEIDLKVIDSKSKSKCSYEKGKFNINTTINVFALVNSNEDKSNINPENISKVEKSAEKNLKNMCEKLFIENQDKKIDIVGAQKLLYRKYPQYSNKDILPDTNLQLNVHVTIKRSSKDYINIDPIGTPKE